MNKSLPLLVSAILLASTSLIAQTTPSPNDGYSSYENCGLSFYNGARFPSMVEQSYHIDQNFAIHFDLNQGSSLEFNESSFSAQGVLALTSATLNSLVHLNDAIISQQSRSTDNGYYNVQCYTYNFTPISIGTTDLLFTITDKNGISKTVTVSITIIP